MNILERVGQYAADFNNPGVLLVYVPGELNLHSGGSVTPGIFNASGDSQFDRTRLRQIRAEAIEANQLRILFIASYPGAGNFTSLDTEVDVVLSVEFGVTSGVVKVVKFRAVEEKPKDTTFTYEA